MCSWDGHVSRKGSQSSDLRVLGNNRESSRSRQHPEMTLSTLQKTALRGPQGSYVPRAKSLVMTPKTGVKRSR